MRTPIFIALLVSTALPATAAELSPRCAAKQADIEANISAATARGNTRELAGLNKALRATKANCTEESLKEEKEARVRKANFWVSAGVCSRKTYTALGSRQWGRGSRRSAW